MPSESSNPPPSPTPTTTAWTTISKILYGFVGGVMDGHLDAGGDLSSNANELANRTDPHNAFSALRILSPEKSTGYTPGIPMFDVIWSTFPGLSYTLEFDASLSFSSPDTQGPFIPTGFTETKSLLLSTPSRDYLRIRRN